MSSKISTCILRVDGTHCRSCELLIEKEIGRLPGVKSVTASTADSSVVIDYVSGKKPSINYLNKLFGDSNYLFSNQSDSSQSGSTAKPDFFLSLLIALGLVGIVYLINQSSVFSTFNVGAGSLPPSFFIFGLIAGLSTCAALVGGILLSLTRQWFLNSPPKTFSDRLKPVLTFNLGRLILFSLFGAGLGFFGSFFKLSLTSGAIITILVSLVILFIGLDMINLPFIKGIQFSLPKAITRPITDETRFKGSFLAFLMGGLTFFLPCGFTLTAQSIALASGSWYQGALIMFFFALGTLIPLSIIGITGAESQRRPLLTKYFSQVVGIILVIVSIYTVYNQSVVLGFSGVSSARSSGNNQSFDSQVELAPLVGGKFLLQMTATASQYTPNHFVVKAGQPVRWEITDRGTSGCSNAIISRSLFDGQISLSPGKTSVKEFVAPSAPGNYRFSCWMGMISGIIEVVE